MYTSIASRGDGVLQPIESDWDEARRFFEERKIRRADLGGAGDWAGWSEELDGVRTILHTTREVLLFLTHPCSHFQNH